jgi:AraC-like DNA-binding protein
VRSGAGTYTINGITYDIRPGDLFVVTDRQTHSLNVSAVDRFTLLFGKTFLWSLLPPGEAAEVLDAEPYERAPRVALDGEEREAVESLMLQMLRETRLKSSVSRRICIGYLTALAGLVRRAWQRPSSTPCVLSQSTRVLISRLIPIIKANLSEPLSLGRLAEIAGLSPTYLSSCFHRATGVPLVAYINRERVQMAKSLLRETELKVSAICYEVGFNDLAHFNRVFKRETHLSPLRYRRYHKVYDGSAVIPAAPPGLTRLAAAQ